MTGPPTLAVEPRRVRVALGERGYDILIGPGLIARAGEAIAAAAPGARLAIVTDETVGRLHLDALEAGVARGSALAGPSMLVAPGEASKSLAQLTLVCHHLLDLRLERGDAVVAFGGGVIGDLAGFAASIVKRGLRLVQIPTTLLAQVDSSVGGKTGVNTPHGKNLIGSFHQPALVLADTGALATLDAREFRAGYAEVVKYGLLGDAAFFHWLETRAEAVLAQEPAALAEAIEKSCAAKAAIVMEDERETGRRALLNLGHTFGHALEAWAGYDGALIHGEGVAIGMALAFRLSERLGLCPPGESARVAAHLARAGLPTGFAALRRLTNRHLPSPARLVGLMAQDKKMTGGRLTLILARRIGEAFVTRDVGAGDVERFLAEELGAAQAHAPVF